MEEKVQKSVVDVSVIIVNTNSTDLLENCLKSIIDFTKDLSYELIVVDNNSVDRDVNELLKNFDGIKLVKNKANIGFGGANNRGACIAKGKYILFLNNDTILFENTIKIVFDYAESRNGNNIIGCKLLNEDKSFQKSVIDFPTLLNVFTSNFFLYLLFPKSKYFNKYHLMNKGIKETFEVDVVTGAFLFLNRTSFEALNGFDERFFVYMEEIDLCYRHKQNGGSVVYYPETSLIHLKGKTVKGESWFKNKTHSISTIKYFQKHFNGPAFFQAIIFHYIGLVIRIPVFFFVGIIRFDKNLIKRSYFYTRLIFLYPINKFKN